MLGIRSKPKGAIEGIHRSLLSSLMRGTTSGPSGHSGKNGHSGHSGHSVKEGNLTKEGEDGKEGKEGLTNQDMMKLVHPHVTILNKAESNEDVKRCLDEVSEVFGGMEGGERKGRAVGFEV